MTTKTLDSVKLMRELRDKLSQEMEHMTADERLRYIRGKAASTRIRCTTCSARPTQGALSSVW
jgi:hypothetical protein